MYTYITAVFKGNYSVVFCFLSFIFCFEIWTDRKVRKTLLYLLFVWLFSNGRLRCDKYFSFCLAVNVLFTCLVNIHIYKTFFFLLQRIVIDCTPNTPKYFTGSFNDSFCAESFDWSETQSICFIDWAYCTSESIGSQLVLCVLNLYKPL